MRGHSGRRRSSARFGCADDRAERAAAELGQAAATGRHARSWRGPAPLAAPVGSRPPRRRNQPRAGPPDIVIVDRCRWRSGVAPLQPVDLTTRGRLQDSVRALGEEADANRAELERRAMAHDDPGCPPDRPPHTGPSNRHTAPTATTAETSATNAEHFRPTAGPPRGVNDDLTDADVLPPPGPDRAPLGPAVRIARNRRAALQRASTAVTPDGAARQRLRGQPACSTRPTATTPAPRASTRRRSSRTLAARPQCRRCRS
jgi:hypothetical protein